MNCKQVFSIGIIDKHSSCQAHPLQISDEGRLKDLRLQELYIRQLKIEHAKAQDVKAIIALEKTVFPQCDVFTKAHLARLLKSPNSITLVMRDKYGRVVAEIVGLMRNYKDKPSGRIYKIATARFLMGKKIAERLLNEMEKLFVKNGMKAVCAEVRESNTASRRFFMKHGYISTNILPFYYADGEDGYKFWKQL